MRFYMSTNNHLVCSSHYCFVMLFNHKYLFCCFSYSDIMRMECDGMCDNDTHRVVFVHVSDQNVYF